MSYRVEHGAVSAGAIEDCRSLLMTSYNEGLSEKQVWDAYNGSAFTHLQEARQVYALRNAVHRFVHFRQGDLWCWPHIVLRVPWLPTYTVPHVDIQPKAKSWDTYKRWHGRRYSTILGVPLVAKTQLTLWTAEGGELIETIEYSPGDVLVMDGAQCHQAVPSPDVRLVVYYRTLRKL